VASAVHPDQASQAALRGYIDNHVIDPVHQVHDPAFYDYPMPDLPVRRRTATAASSSPGRQVR